MKPLHDVIRIVRSVRVKPRTLAVAVVALPLLLQAAAAQDATVPAPDYRSKAGDLTVRLGAAGVFFDTSASVELGGAKLPNASVETTDAFTGALEVEYYLRPSFSVSLTAGIPPLTDVDGTGPLEPFGKLGEVRYGLAAVLAKYHFDRWGRFQPFLGAGASYFAVFDTEDAALGDLDVDDAFAPVIQAGADFMVSERVGLYASVTHAFLDTEGSGTALGLPVTADIELDPTVVQGGLLVRF